MHQRRAVLGNHSTANSELKFIEVLPCAKFWAGNGDAAVGGGKKVQLLPSQNVESDEARCQHVPYSVLWGHFGVLLSPSPSQPALRRQTGFSLSYPQKD